MAILLIVGVALRARALLAGRSLWLDEAMLALNICGRSFAELTGPLDGNQGAPIGFLWIERLAVVAFGPSEIALRLVPFAAAITALGLVAWFCRARLGPGAAGVGLALGAFMPAMIYYAGEAKQYSVDIAVGLLIVAVASGALRDGLTPRRALGLAIVGSVAVWLSHPAVFALAGAGTTLLIREALRRRSAGGALAVATAAAWAASFLVSYRLSLRGLQANAYLATFWGDAFLNFPPRSAADLRRYLVVFLGLFEAMYQNYQAAEGLEGRMAVLAAVVWLLGVAALARGGHRDLLALLTAPLGFAVVAAMLHLYPLRFRMVLFLLGPNLLVMAAGLVAALRSADPSLRTAGRIVLLGVGLLPAVQGMQSLLQRPQPYGARPVLERLGRECRPGDLVVVDAASEPPYRFYREHGRIAGLERPSPLRAALELRDPEQLRRLLAGLRGRPRVWLLITAHLGDPGGREDRFLRLVLERAGRRCATIAASGYQAHLCDFSGAAGP